MVLPDDDVEVEVSKDGTLTERIARLRREFEAFKVAAEGRLKDLEQRVEDIDELLVEYLHKVDRLSGVVRVARRLARGAIRKLRDLEARISRPPEQ